jgi:hypothetical protein
MLAPTGPGRNGTWPWTEQEAHHAVHDDRALQESRCRAVYRHFREHGRMLPDGLTYVGSWVEANLDRCFQLMECEDARLLQQWANSWHGLIDFEFIPVVPGKDTAVMMEQVT